MTRTLGVFVLAVVVAGSMLAASGGQSAGHDRTLIATCVGGPGVALLADAKDDGWVDSTDFGLRGVCATVSGVAVSGARAGSDVDGDDDAGLADYAGPTLEVRLGRPPARPGCWDADLDADGDVDTNDFATFQACFNGGGRPPACPSGPAGPAAEGFAFQGHRLSTYQTAAGAPLALYDFRARTYDLHRGRWLQRDPTGFSDGPNLYEAFAGNATSVRDPLGTFGWVYTEGQGDLAYWNDSGFQWTFGRKVSDQYVLIDHPEWPYAFLMDRDAARYEFRTLFWDPDFHHPLEIMRRATVLAGQAGTQGQFAAIFDKQAATRGWVRPHEVTMGPRAETYHQFAQPGLSAQITPLANLTAVSFVVVTGGLAGTAGPGAAAVDVIATAADAATGRTDLPRAAPALTVAGAGAVLYLRMGGADSTLIGPSFRTTRSAVEGSSELPAIGRRWLRGSHGNVGVVPKQVADRLRGRTFSDFDEFRSAFWRAVADDPLLTLQFGAHNVARMKQGLAPIAPASQHYGELRSYILPHRVPLQRGGAVYNLDNILIVTPRHHQEVLLPEYHFGR